jgi:putative oxidoreductase
MKIISAIPRILLGLVFGVMPWTAILHLAPNPTLPPEASAFVGALMKTGYMLPLVWGTEIVAGLLILFGIFVPFALVLLAPVLVNILLYHVFLARSGLELAIVLCLFELFVAWQHRRAFDSLFVSAPAAEPSRVAAPAVSR